ncbi:MAG: PIN domain-containing protein [Candidatus Woesearchaeota archaeon]
MGHKKTSPKNRQCYLDACALHESKSMLGQLYSKKSKEKIQPITSHLSLGEAIGNILYKKHADPKVFVESIEKFIAKGILKITGNDDVKKYMEAINLHIRLSETDTMHVATAIKNKCDIFITTDSDILKQKKALESLIYQQFSLHICITDR